MFAVLVVDLFCFVCYSLLRWFDLVWVVACWVGFSVCGCLC